MRKVLNYLKNFRNQIFAYRNKITLKYLITVIYRRFRKLILYGIIGCIASGLDFVVFTLLTKTSDIHFIVANCFSVIVGITTSFILNRAYNFKIKDKTWKRFLIFLSVGLLGLCLSNLILWIGVEVLQAEGLIAKLASIVLVVFFQFLLNKFITFRTKPNK